VLPHEAVSAADVLAVGLPLAVAFAEKGFPVTFAHSVQGWALTWTAARDPLGKVAALNRGEAYRALGRWDG